MVGVVCRRSVAVTAMFALVVPLGLAVLPAVVATQPGEEVSSSLAPSTDSPEFVIPNPMTLAERLAQVEELAEVSASPTPPADIVVEDGQEVLTLEPGVQEVLFIDQQPAGQQPLEIHATLATPPDPPFDLEWWESLSPLDPGEVGWGAQWTYSPNTSASHYTVHRASDDALIRERCFSYGSVIGGAANFFADPGLVLGEGYYMKIAASSTPGPVGSAPGWSCGTDWSEEAVSPVFEAIGGNATMRPSEKLGCGYDNTTGRPCVQQYRGDPVNTATGTLSEGIMDAVVRAPGVDLELLRTYSSAGGISSVLGPQWSLSYPVSLSVTGDSAAFQAADGSYAHFRHEGGGVWSHESVAVQAVLAGTSAAGFTLTTPDQEVLTFNGAGDLITWHDRSGVGLSFSYSGDRLAGITDGAGRTVTFTYDTALDRLTTVTLADGRWVGYSYADGRLTAVRDLNGGITEYGYDSGGRLSSITDQNGDVIMQTTYENSTGKVLWQDDAHGGPLAFFFTESAALFFDGNGGIWTDRYVGDVLSLSAQVSGDSR